MWYNAWYSDSSNGTTYEVGQKEPNAFGLYDILGNVWEWCWDWFGSTYPSSAEDPMGASSGIYRVYRGGSWDDPAVLVRSGITMENILSRQLPRNRLVATVLSLCGLVERAGQGMNLMYELSVKDAKPLPDFNGSDEYFITLTLNGVMTNKKIPVVLNNIDEEKLELLSTDDFLLIDAIFNEKTIPKNLMSNIEKLENMGIIKQTDLESNGGINGGIKLELSESAKMALVIISKKPTITTEGLALELGKTAASADKILRELKKKGRIKRAGSKKSGYWEVLQSLLNSNLKTKSTP